MNREDNIAEVGRQLNDQNYYEKLHENPHETFKTEMQEGLSEMKDSHVLNRFENVSIPNETRMPQFYILPKTHTPNNPCLLLGYPGKPIMYACGSLTENTSSFIDSILKPHMEALSSYIKDTNDFITKIRQLPQLSKDSFLVTWDVGSLYSNIPHSDGIGMD